MAVHLATRANVEHLLGHPRFELIRHDVTFPLYVEVDEIYHLACPACPACPASPVHYQRGPVQTTKTAGHGSVGARQAHRAGRLHQVPVPSGS